MPFLRVYTTNKLCDVLRLELYVTGFYIYCMVSFKLDKVIVLHEFLKVILVQLICINCEINCKDSFW